MPSCDLHRLGRDQPGDRGPAWASRCRNILYPKAVYSGNILYPKAVYSGSRMGAGLPRGLLRAGPCSRSSGGHVPHRPGPLRACLGWFDPGRHSLRRSLAVRDSAWKWTRGARRRRPRPIIISAPARYLLKGRAHSQAHQPRSLHTGRNKPAPRAHLGRNRCPMHCAAAKRVAISLR